MVVEPAGNPFVKLPPPLDGGDGGDGGDVKDALNEVVEAIKEGSRLNITEDVIQGYRELYRPDFETQFKNPSADWNQDKQRVLPLAHVVGALATMLTMLQAVRQPKAIPPDLDPQCAYTAAHLLANGNICHVGMPEQGDLSVTQDAVPPGGDKPTGAYCTSVPLNPPGVEQLHIAQTIEAMKALVAGLKKILP